MEEKNRIPWRELIPDAMPEREEWHLLIEHGGTLNMAKWARWQHLRGEWGYNYINQNAVAYYCPFSKVPTPKDYTGRLNAGTDKPKVLSGTYSPFETLRETLK
jgi:hypothetical protein